MVQRPSSPRPEPTIPQFYAGRSIFITGATGFMGKVLVERLLSMCPEVARLYLLMRHKKDVPPEKRLLQLKQSQVFDNVRVRDPSQLDKLCIVPGDTALPDLGISAESLMQLREVSVVFHSAATLKFDEALGKAVDQNVRSVIRLMDICDRLPNIVALVHVSTAYSNAELSHVEERVYAAPAPLAHVLALAASVPEDVLQGITDKYIHPKPNTYTFTKALAENAIEEHKTRTYPVAIFRPTIVISSHRVPYPGWIENLNGPSGVVVGAGKGLLHVFNCRGAARADLLPVDLAIHTLLAVAWETALDKSPEARVYNCSSGARPTTWRQFENALRRHLRAHPLDCAYWYPSGASVENKYAQKALEFLLQTMPLHLAEYTARIFRIKTKLSLITVSNRLSSMSEVLRFFSMREWSFSTSNVRRLQARLAPEDAAVFNMDPTTIDWDEHYKNFVKGTRKYLLKEKDQDITEAKRHLRKMFFVHYGVLFFVAVLVLRVALQNPAVRAIVYGTLRLGLSLFNSLYTKLTPPLLRID